VGGLPSEAARASTARNAAGERPPTSSSLPFLFPSPSLAPAAAAAANASSRTADSTAPPCLLRSSAASFPGTRAERRKLAATAALRSPSQALLTAAAFFAERPFTFLARTRAAPGSSRASRALEGPVRLLMEEENGKESVSFLSFLKKKKSQV